MHNNQATMFPSYTVSFQGIWSSESIKYLQEKRRLETAWLGCLIRVSSDPLN